jgi:hypothetical protein
VSRWNMLSNALRERPFKSLKISDLQADIFPQERAPTCILTVL